MIKAIETKRLILIEYTYEMIEATIAGIDKLEEVCGYHVSRDWPGIDFFFYLPYVLENVKKKETMTKWTRLVILRSERKVIGEIGGQGDPERTGEIELGYSIVEDYQGYGYMTEAIRGMVDWLENESLIKRIFARCYESNKASIGVLEKNEFSYQSDQDKEEVGGRIMTFERVKRGGLL